MRRLDAHELTGRSSTHIQRLEEPSCALHVEVIAPFLELRAAAAQAGFDLVPVSSFRDFSRQQFLWNSKYRGDRESLDRRGQPIDMTALAPAERIESILCWSALPGASRHHWGTDLDVYDRAAVPEGYELQLVPAEYAPGGPFAALHDWLSEHLDRYGFYRPYQRDLGGVSPEPWHISYAPLASECLQALSVEILRQALREGDVEGGEVLLSKVPELHERFARRVEVPPTSALAHELRDHRRMV
ncbi:MAG: D-alanyl-D-alanine carboxypeptidase family protein [Sinobacteraceae bacterium]|nr:D-alanyl-D-alanine carboxypeptidase family protein [Nevskiaceae bacterium]